MTKHKEQPEKEPVTREDAAHAVNCTYAYACGVFHAAVKSHERRMWAHRMPIESLDSAESDDKWDVLRKFSKASDDAEIPVSKTNKRTDALYEIYEQLKEPDHDKEKESK